MRLAAGAAVPVVGQILFWDISVADNLYQVTTAENASTDAAMFIAGICLTPLVTVGNSRSFRTRGTCRSSSGAR